MHCMGWGAVRGKRPSLLQKIRRKRGFPHFLLLFGSDTVVFKLRKNSSETIEVLCLKNVFFRLPSNG